jgi:hypothetical protein
MTQALRWARYAAAVVVASIAGFCVLAVVVAPTNAASVFFAACALGLGYLTYALWPWPHPRPGGWKNLSTIESDVAAIHAPERAPEALAATMPAVDGQRPRRRRVIERETRRRGFFGWVFLVIFLAFNAFMVFFLITYWNLLAEMPATKTEWERAGATIGGILGTGTILFFWASGGVITGLLALLTRGRKRQTIIEEEIEP